MINDLMGSTYFFLKLIARVSCYSSEPQTEKKERSIALEERVVGHSIPGGHD